MAKKNKAVKIDFEKLKKPFTEKEVDWRIINSGVKEDEMTVWAFAAPFISARSIHDRLDEVCGSENWQLQYKEHLGETVCEIGIRTENGWNWKSGGSDRTSIEAFKGGLSTAEKRAGVPWGIGRYLYRLNEVSVSVSRAKQNGDMWRYQPKDDEKHIPAFWWRLPFETPEEKEKTFINVYQYRELISLARDTGCPVIKTLNGMAKEMFSLEKITDLSAHRFDEARKLLLLKKKSIERKAQEK